jgi:lysophospholipase L1-like esterase
MAMQSARGRILLVAALLAAAACGGANESSQDDSPATTGAGSGAGAGGAGGSDLASVGNGASGGSSPTGTGGSAGVGGSGTGAGGAAPMGLPDVGTLVVLGDSIGDGGGQGPFYYALLRDELEAFYGHDIAYQNRADSGSKTGALVGQINGLPGTLAGPVAVAITSGGNDMKDQLFAILTGSDGPARMQMGANVAAALDALLEPGRFGAGVAVHVYEANIYDASDGQGNFGSSGCNIGLDSPSSTDPFFASWNGEIAARVGEAAQVVTDMHGHFYGHGFNNPPSWYAGDCTHPNTSGHAELAGLFASLITGS